MPMAAARVLRNPYLRYRPLIGYCQQYLPPRYRFLSTSSHMCLWGTRFNQGPFERCLGSVASGSCESFSTFAPSQSPQAWFPKEAEIWNQPTWLPPQKSGILST